MPIKIIADTRELLIDIFFAIIITVGMANFVEHFILGDIFTTLNPTDLFSLFKTFLLTGILIDALFFFAAYFLVISHWVFYHELIEKYPYYNWWKFFVDIALFSVMFLIINISYSVYTIDDNKEIKPNSAITSLFILLLDIWYLLSCLWHLSDRTIRPVTRYLYRHIKRIITYTVLLALLYIPVPMLQTNPWYQNAVMLGVIASMIVWNLHRLSKFLNRDLREYRLFSKSNSLFGSVSGGTLRLVKYPMKKREGQKEKDILVIEIDDKRNDNSLENPINILPENIRSVKRIEGEGDLMVEITHETKNSKVSSVLLNIDDRAMNGVEKAINELCESNRKKN
jgi:hypothetical protein